MTPSALPVLTEPYPRLAVAGLVTLWDMRQVAGNQVLDGSGNNRPLALAADPARPTPGADGLSFDGGDWADSNLTTLGTVGLFAGGAQPWTVAVLARPITAASSGTILARAGATAGSRTFTYYVNATNGNMNVNLRGVENGPMYVNDGKWHWLAIRYDGSAAKYAVDGRLSIGNLSIGTAAEEATQRIIVGARTNGTAIFLTAGSKVGWIAFWERALSAAELLENFEYVARVFAPSGVRIGQ